MNKDISTHQKTENNDPIDSKKSLWQKIGSFLGILHDYSAKDIGRIREAAIKQIEMKAAVLQANAQAKMAEAEERNAKAERTRAEAAKIQADAIASVVLAIERIESKGGKVNIDEGRLLQLLGRIPRDEQD